MAPPCVKPSLPTLAAPTSSSGISLAARLGRQAHRSGLLINALAEDVRGALSASAKRIGGPLLIGKIWERLGIGDVLSELLKDRSFEFAVERAVLVAMLHRLFVSGSDRDCSVWIEDYDIAGAQGLGLHHFYRAMAWGSARRSTKSARTRLRRAASRMRSTTLSFYGEGGETLGEHGYSKEYRPDLKQMILRLVVDGAGRPICTEMWPGNTADVTTLLPVIDRLRRRFPIGLCRRRSWHDLDGDNRGARGAQARIYSGFARAHRCRHGQIVLANNDPFVPLLVERKAGQTQLFVKQVMIEGKRYVVCRNEEEAEKDRKDRAAIVAALDEQLKEGDKALIGNSAYRRYLHKVSDKDERSFEIDAGRLAEEAHFDGFFVLRTNAKVNPLQAVLRYRDLLRVEDLFRRTKAIMRTRPIFHSSDAAIREHVFCSFLALSIQKHLDDLAREAGVTPEWKHLLRDLNRLIGPYVRSSVAAAADAEPAEQDLIEQLIAQAANDAWWPWFAHRGGRSKADVPAC
jgi:hypothetical protein